MNSSRKTAITVGIFYILSSLTGVLSVYAFGSILEGSDFLNNVSMNQNRMIIGTILLLLCAGAFVGVAISVYPVLAKHSKRVAVGYVVGRSFEAVPFIVNAVCLLSLITLSQNYIQMEAQDASNAVLIGTGILALSHWADLLGPIILCGVAAIPFYYLLYRTRLVPRWITIWGLLGTVLYLTAGVLVFWGLSISSPLAQVLIVPFAINEMVLAIWLIVKGFND